MQRRQHRRVRLRLPARLRWVAPLGQKIEQCETRNASRGGLLLACHERHSVGMPLWVTFPYDPALPEGQPEVLARVLRCEDVQETSGRVTTVAVHFESALRPARTATGKLQRDSVSSKASRPVAIPIRVRPERVPWFEEAMTLDVSPDTLRFVTNRIYSPGEALRISFAVPESSPWRDGTEQAARVIQVDPLPESSSLAVTVKRISA